MLCSQGEGGGAGSDAVDAVLHSTSTPSGVQRTGCGAHGCGAHAVDGQQQIQAVTVLMRCVLTGLMRSVLTDEACADGECLGA